MRLKAKKEKRKKGNKMKSDILTTKQIFNLLSNNKITSKLFKGVYSMDRLPAYGLSHSQKPAIIILNHGSSQTDGNHWTLLYFPKSKMEKAYFFDSFGSDITIPEVKLFVQRNSIIGHSFNALRLQDLKSTSCGYFVVIIAYLLSAGIDPMNLTSFFSLNHLQENDAILLKLIKWFF